MYAYQSFLCQRKVLRIFLCRISEDSGNRNFTPWIFDRGVFCIMGNFVPHDTKTLCGDAHRCAWKMPLVQPHPAYFYA